VREDRARVRVGREKLTFRVLVENEKLTFAPAPTPGSHGDENTRWDTKERGADGYDCVCLATGQNTGNRVQRER
jgi:hypothetical protein